MTPSPPDRTGPPPRPLEFQRMFAEVRGRLIGSAEPVRVGRYELRERLGAGGMGVVYAAYDAELGRRVAVKLLHETGAEGQARDRILREAQALARLSHPNVVQIYEIGAVGRQVFVAMEFAEGLTLAQWQAQRRGWRELLAVYVDAGRGLAAAHAAGLVHRDVKPENVLVGADGRVRVLDFGLARGVAEAIEPGPAATHDALLAPITATGAVMGTPAYMSPEQWRGEPTDARSDQFSFCVALYAAVHGGPAVRGGGPARAAGPRARGGAAAAAGAGRGSRASCGGRCSAGCAGTRASGSPTCTALLAALERVRRGRPVAWLGLGVLALGVGAALGGRWSAPEEPVPRDMCKQRRAGGGGVERAAARRRSAGRSSRPTAADAGEVWAQVAAQVDEYAAAWAEQPRGGLRATRSSAASARRRPRDLSEGPYLTDGVPRPRARGAARVDRRVHPRRGRGDRRRGQGGVQAAVARGVPARARRWR
jgi:predicted Ser/Thr protein kinase